MANTTVWAVLQWCVSFGKNDYVCGMFTSEELASEWISKNGGSGTYYLEPYILNQGRKK